MIDFGVSAASAIGKAQVDEGQTHRKYTALEVERMFGHELAALQSTASGRAALGEALGISIGEAYPTHIVERLEKVWAEGQLSNGAFASARGEQVRAAHLEPKSNVQHEGAEPTAYPTDPNPLNRIKEKVDEFADPENDVRCGMPSVVGAGVAGALASDPWIHRSANMKCRTCMHYVPKVTATIVQEEKYPEIRKLMEGRGKVGRCRRHAPTMSGFPVVFETDWCGDHKLNEEALNGDT